MNKSKKRRVSSVNANRSRRLPFSLSPSRSVFPTLTELEDRRTWNPLGSVAPARSISRDRHRLQATAVTTTQFRSNSRPAKFSHFIGFALPRKVLICIRRKRRKEVLHARRKTGKSGQKRPVRNFYSKIKC